MADLSSKAIDELRRNARSVIRELGLLNDAYFEIGVTLAERHLLIELAGTSKPTMGEIAERLLLDKSTISRLISKAVKKGYIDCITDDNDRRKRFLQLTEIGKQTLNAFEPIAFNQTKQALQTLTPDEIKTVYQGVALYAKGLRNSRLKQCSNTEKLSENGLEANIEQKIESLSEIYDRLNQMGCSLQIFEQKDEEELYEIFREVVETGSQFPYECSSKEEFKLHFFTPQGQVYVCHNSDGKVIGGFYLRANYSGRSNHIANAAYMINSAHRGKGVGVLLIKASLHLSKNLGFQAIQFNMVLSQNTRPIKIYQKLGFKIAGIINDAVRNSDGNYQDGYVMHRKL